MADVTIEFYGIPRQRAGRSEVTVPATTVRGALAAVEVACPGLRGMLIDGRLTPHYRLALDGGRFVTDLNRDLQDGARLLLLSADAGG
jgi:molybdopterin converting factor small subunit